MISELFTRGFISTVAWAIGLIFRSIIGRLVIAVAALFLGFVVTLYALWGKAETTGRTRGERRKVLDVSPP